MSKNLQRTKTSFKSILDKLDIDETLTSLLVCDSLLKKNDNKKKSFGLLFYHPEHNRPARRTIGVYTLLQSLLEYTHYCSHY